jgi:hypothetical protein
MSSLYFGFDVSCQFEASVSEFDAVYSVHCTLYTSTYSYWRGNNCESNSMTLASNRQNTSSPKYNDYISLLILEYIIFGGR